VERAESTWGEKGELFAKRGYSGQKERWASQQMRKKAPKERKTNGKSPIGPVRRTWQVTLGKEQKKRENMKGQIPERWGKEQI